MRTSTLLRGLALTVCAAIVAGSGSMLADEKAREGRHPDHSRCAKACAECMQQCSSCAHHCGHLAIAAEETQRKEHQMTAAICTDCADICAAAANMVARHGPLQGVICESCAKACDRCGSRCEKFTNDEHMQRCAKACRDCAAACRDMLKHMGHEHQARTSR
jgi:hypothetical protein